MLCSLLGHIKDSQYLGRTVQGIVSQSPVPCLAVRDVLVWEKQQASFYHVDNFVLVHVFSFINLEY